MEPNATVTIIRTTGARDIYGDPVADSPTETNVQGLYAPEVDQELNEPGRRGTVTAGTLYILEETSIDYTDQVRIDGTVFDVTSSPQRWMAPGGRFKGIVVQIRRPEG